jgi:hypothetical protein
VNGNGKSSNNHLSLFLQVADSDDLPFGWKKHVSYILTLEHPTNPKLSYAKRNPDKTFKLCPKAIDWGWSQFITSDRIQQDEFVAPADGDEKADPSPPPSSDPSDPSIPPDSLLVRAVVTVKSSATTISPADSELYLKCAVEDGSTDDVRSCLSQGASVNCQFRDDLYTPLHTACSTSRPASIAVLDLLLGHAPLAEDGQVNEAERADPNAVNKWKETPLLIAANNGNEGAVRALLAARADPSKVSAWGGEEGGGGRSEPAPLL